MEHIIDLLRTHGIRDIVVTLCAKGDLIEQHFGDGKRLGVTLTYVREYSPLGTAGSVRQAASLLEDTFLVISGDVLTDIDLGEVIDFHHKRNAQVTLALTRVKNPLEYGVVLTDSRGKVKMFYEKPGWGEVFSDLINTGIYVLEPVAIRAVPPGVQYDFSKDLFPRLLSEGADIFGIRSKGYWCDIGTVSQYRQANADALARRVKLHIPGEEIAPGVFAGEGTAIYRGASFEPPVCLGKHVVVKQSARLRSHCVIGDGCVLNEEARLEDSVLWAGVSVGSSARLSGAVVCSGARLADEVVVHEGAAVGEGASLGAGSTVRSDARVWSGENIEERSVVGPFAVASPGGGSMFRSRGIRVRYGQAAGPEQFCSYGGALCALLGTGSYILASGQSRISRLLCQAVSLGIQSCGSDVCTLPVGTPAVVRHAIRATQARGGAYVLEEDDLCFVEFYDGAGLPLSRDQERKFENVLSRMELPRAARDQVGESRLEDDLVLGYIMSLPRCTGRSVAVAGGIKELSRLVFPSATLAEGEEELKQALQEGKASFGLLLDSLGESIKIYLPGQTMLSGQQVASLVLSVLLRVDPRKEVYLPVNMSQSVENVALAHGCKVTRTRTQARPVLEAEFDHFLYDGYRAAAYLAMFSESGGNIKDMVSSLSPVYISVKSVTCPLEVKANVMSGLIQSSLSNRVVLIEGVKAFHDQGWVLVLPDAERPACAVYAEGVSMEVADDLTAMYAKRIQELIGRSTTSPAN